MLPDPKITIFGAHEMRRSTLLTVAYTLTVTTLLLYVSAPGVAPGLLVGCMLLALTLSRADKPSFRENATSDVLVLVGLWLSFCLWMLLSNLWSPNPRHGLPSALWCLAAALLTFATLRSANQVASASRLLIAKAFLVSFFLGAGLLLFEALTGMAARRWVMSFVPRLMPAMAGAEVKEGWVVAVPFYLIKKNAAVVMLMLWPALLIAARLATSATHRIAIAAAIALVVISILVADHDTSKVALAFSAGVWVLGFLTPRAAKPAVIILWCSATLAVVPLSLIAYHAEFHKVESLKYSARHRIAIWGYTAELVLRQPIFGAGVAATRYIDEHASTPMFIPGSDVPAGPNVHSHNVFLQTWHELGAIGAMLLCLTGLRTIMLIGRQSRNDQAYLFASFSAVAVIASLSWSMIAAWFIAAFGLTAIFTQLACYVSRDNAQTKENDASPLQQDEEPVPNGFGV